MTWRSRSVSSRMMSQLRSLRTVVDEHDLVIVADTLPCRRAQPLVERPDAAFLIEAGNDDRQRWIMVSSR